MENPLTSLISLIALDDLTGGQGALPEATGNHVRTTLRKLTDHLNSAGSKPRV